MFAKQSSVSYAESNGTNHSVVISTRIGSKSTPRIRSTLNLLNGNTKYSPKCEFPVEKNGGCNYVMCTKYMYSFCYDCLGKFSHWRCIGAQRNDAIEARNENLRLKSELHLYPFYKNSYQNQLKQLNL